ncbi:MAG: PAS domain-containing protein, partial [Acidobacteriota bacterium]|nr:PAS domain-containing protein [Acidobacteriota bacterium]
MTILIVDDNEMNLYQLQVLLGASGYQVVTAANGAEALTTARQNPPDLIVSDILMPVMDGFALCHEWKKDERLRQIPFIFYTATYTDERDRQFALSLGAEQFLVKPEEPEVFMRTIREVIQQVQLPPAPPASLPVEEPPKEESGYLRQYNDVLIRKLEQKMQKLEVANRELERDITQRKRVEQELRRVNRALQTISECNQALVRATEESHLLDDICGILVREGGYRMAWVGFGEHDEGKSVRPVAHAGFEEGYLPTANITWADTEHGWGPTGTAIRTGKPVVTRDFGANPSLAAWRQEALQRGYASATALPILVNDQVLGALSIYAKEVDAFDSEEMQLLTELSNDLAYGIQALRTRAEHKRAEEEISHLASFPMLNPQPVIEVDLDGRVCYRNQAARQFLPDSFQLATNHPFLANWSAVVDACRRGDDPPTRTVPIGDRWYEQVIHYVRDTQRVRIYSFEVTERKRAEEALVEERHLLHTLMDNLPDKIYFKDRESRFTQINLALAKELKLSHPAQAVGKTDFDVLPGEQSKEFYRDEQEIIRTGQPLVDKEEKLIWPGGNITWLSTTKMPLRDPNGKIVGTFGVSRDISEHKRAEEELLFKTALLEAESETTIDGILVADRSGQVLLANSQFARMWNIPDETIRAK